MYSSRTPSLFEYRVLRSWARDANANLGPLAFTLGLACSASDSPRLFGNLSLLFVIAAALDRQRPYSRIYQLWREVKHPFIQFRVVWRYFAVSMFGWGFLGMVALGLVTKSTISALCSVLRV